MDDNRCAEVANNIINDILRKIPRPNYSELPLLYNELDEIAREVCKVLTCSRFFDAESLTVRFSEMTEQDVAYLIKRNPNVMVPFFVMICGFSVRELERLYGIQNVYSLRESVDEHKLKEFSRVIRELLEHELSLETVLYKFYKNWEEHQKRHRRAREVEEYVASVLRGKGYNVEKVSIECKGKKREIDCAILPPDAAPEDRSVLVAIQIRTGVFRDLVKRAKEYSTEFDELMECYPNVKFVVVYLVSPHEKRRLEKIRRQIESERSGKRPYDLILLTRQDVEDLLIKKLEEWGMPHRPHLGLGASQPVRPKGVSGSV